MYHVDEVGITDIEIRTKDFIQTPTNFTMKGCSLLPALIYCHQQTLRLQIKLMVVMPRTRFFPNVRKPFGKKIYVNLK